MEMSLAGGNHTVAEGPDISKIRFLDIFLKKRKRIFDPDLPWYST